MNLTIEKWKAMPEITLPWKGKETGFELTNLIGKCGTCGTGLTDLRGEITEAFGAVEIRMGGICRNCKTFVPCRSRIRPDRKLHQQLKDGKWESYNMITMNRKWYRESVRAFTPMAFGLSISVVLTLLLSKPTSLTFIFWAGLLCFFVMVSAWAGYLRSREK